MAWPRSVTAGCWIGGNGRPDFLESSSEVDLMKVGIGSDGVVVVLLAVVVINAVM